MRNLISHFEDSVLLNTFFAGYLKNDSKLETTGKSKKIKLLQMTVDISLV